MEYKYDAQKNNPGYKQLVQNVNITGVWDDHDYGINNGGEDYKDKRGSQRLLLSFLDEPATSDRWKREGLYTSFEFGDSAKNNKLKLIILDTRYFRSDPSNENKQQWQWLEEELKGSDAQIHIFGSSVQLIPADIPVVEKWSDFKHGRTRYKVATPIVLSGDVHHAELFHYTCDQSTLVVHEITSSGMTHYCGSTFPSVICNFVLDTILHGQFSLGSYDGFNYGTVEIDWNASPITVELQVRDSNANIVMSQTVVAAPTPEGNTLCPEHIPRYVYWQARTWVTIILACLLSIVACVIFMVS